MNIFKKMQAALRMREAVRQAQEAHQKTGERYYIMPTSGISGELMIVDRKNFRKLKQKGYINRNTSVASLVRICFYATPYRTGIGEIPVRNENYMSWVEVCKNRRDDEKAKK